MNGPFENFDIPPLVGRQIIERQTRTGVTTSVVEEFAITRNDRVVSTNIAQTMRTRDVVIHGAGFKSNTPFFVFFDGINVAAHVTPTSSTYGMNNATAKGSALRSDNLGVVSATFTIPNTDELSFSTGNKTLMVTTSGDNSASTSSGSAVYSANGEITVMEMEVLSTKNGRVVTDDVSETRELVRYVDPLAQSFLVDADAMQGGIFISSVDIYFGAKDIKEDVNVQIRHMENGFPTQKVLPFGEKRLLPEAVNVSSDASALTKFTFPSPVYLESGREYCVVVMTNSNIMSCWVSEMGQKDIATNDFIDQQPYAGSLFKSQNNSTWTPEQLKDLKLTINRCQFNTDTTSNVVFENGDLGYGKLTINPIETISGTKCFRVHHYSHGNYDEKKSNIVITGVEADRLGSIFALNDDTLARTGSGTMTADTQTGLAQTATSGSGVGAIASIATTTTASTSVIITDPGSGFAAGDTVAFTKDGDVMTFTIDVVKDTLGGIPVEYINRTHSAGTADAKSTSGAKILADIDSYLITIPNSVWPTRIDANDTTPNIQTATESTVGGGSSVTASENLYIDIMHTLIPSIKLPETNITTTFKASSSTQPIVLSAPTESFIKDTVSTSVEINDNNRFTTPKLVASAINETNEMGGAKSSELTIQLTTERNNISPVLDLDSIGLLGIQNRINNVDSILDVSQASETNFVGETNEITAAYVDSTRPMGDSNAAIYMTKRVTLADPAYGIHIYFDGYRAYDNLGNASEIKVYYKVLGPDTNIQFVDVGWVEASLKKDVLADASDFKEYLYEVESIEEFNTFAIKIVLQSKSSSNIPLIENFRAIALST